MKLMAMQQHFFLLFLTLILLDLFFLFILLFQQENPLIGFYAIHVYVFVYKMLWLASHFAGNEYPAIVEFAPFQKVPKRKTKKPDSKKGTLEQGTISMKEAAIKKSSEFLVSWLILNHTCYNSYFFLTTCFRHNNIPVIDTALMYFALEYQLQANTGTLWMYTCTYKKKLLFLQLIYIEYVTMYYQCNLA